MEADSLLPALLRPPFAAGLRSFFQLYGSWKVSGLENVPLSGPLLIAGNHSSDLDPLLAWSAIYKTRRMWGIAKSELWNPPGAPIVMACLYGIPVKRGAADMSMMRRVLDLLKQGEAVGIFPEGTRSADGKLQPAQPGLAWIAQKSGAPITPVGIVGTHKMLPPGAKRLQRTPLTVRFGPAIHFTPDCPRTELLDRVMAAIAEQMTLAGQPTDPPPPAASKERESE